MTDGAGHVPVLLDSVLRMLQPAPGQVAFDLTAGRGGHAEAMAAAVAPGGHLLLCDLDSGNLAFAQGRSLAHGVPVTAVHGNFATIPHAAASRGLAADCVLADLGFSSSQMDDPGRGFSFQHDGPLDMRLDSSRGESASDLIARLPERDLADAIYRLGEDPFSRRIARAIVERRAREPIRTTGALAAAVVAAYGARARQSRMHPATRTFMAIRIMVNGELEALESLLSAIGSGARRAQGGDSSWLRPGCRVGIIAFHSLEDRMVKHAMAAWEGEGLGRRNTRKPVEPSDPEIAGNRRARSAKLRVFRIASPGDRDD